MQAALAGGPLRTCRGWEEAHAAGDALRQRRCAPTAAAAAIDEDALDLERHGRVGAARGRDPRAEACALEGPRERALHEGLRRVDVPARTVAGAA